MLEACEVNPLAERLLWAKSALTVFTAETAHSLYFLTPLIRLVHMNIVLDEIQQRSEKK